MEKKKNLTKKLVITLSSMLLCLLLIGVSVYAAISQSATLNNTISVNTSGQAKAIVTAYETSVTGTTAVTAVPTTEPTWGSAVYTKAETEDNGTHDLTPIVFSQTEGKNVYAYKVEVQNKSDVAVTVAITTTAESNAEIDVYCGEEYATLEKLANGEGVNFSKSNVATDATVTYYILVCANTALADMTAASSTEFDINVVVNA